MRKFLALILLFLLSSICYSAASNPWFSTEAVLNKVYQGYHSTSSATGVFNVYLTSTTSYLSVDIGSHTYTHPINVELTNWVTTSTVYQGSYWTVDVASQTAYFSVDVGSFSYTHPINVELTNQISTGSIVGAVMIGNHISTGTAVYKLAATTGTTANYATDSTNAVQIATSDLTRLSFTVVNYSSNVARMGFDELATEGKSGLYLYPQGGNYTTNYTGAIWVVGDSGAVTVSTIIEQR